MLDQSEFFDRYSLSKKEFRTTGLKWADLVAIHDLHAEQCETLRNTGEYAASRLRSLPAVHSVRMRVKEPEHVVEKIIRKTVARPSLKITPKNYTKKLTDLVGLRALHLFKGDWLAIHDFVKKTWDLKEVPRANVRRGDSTQLLDGYRKAECRVVEHRFGYRSVHYLLRAQPARSEEVLELQVRTIFEEAWSEIDHRVRYPAQASPAVLNEYLVMFNRYAGSADEMGTYLKSLQDHLAERDDEARRQQGEYKAVLASLRETIEALKITKAQKRDLEKKLSSLASAQPGWAPAPVLGAGAITFSPSIIAGSLERSSIQTGEAMPWLPSTSPLNVRFDPDMMASHIRPMSSMSSLRGST